MSADFSHADTPTTRTTTTFTTGGIRLDFGYIKSIPGILKIVEIVLCIIVFICSISACTAVNDSFAGCGWAGFISFIGMLAALASLLLFIFHVDEAVHRVPWLLIDMIVHVAFAVLLLTCVISLATLASQTKSDLWPAGYYQIHSAAAAGSFFAFVAMVVFGCTTFFIFRRWKSERDASSHARDSTV